MTLRVAKKTPKKPSKFLGFMMIAILWILSHGIVQLIINTYFQTIPDTTTTVTTTTMTSILTEPIDLLVMKESLEKTNVSIQLFFANQTMEIGSGTIIQEDDQFYYAITNEHVLRSIQQALSSKVITFEGTQSDFAIITHDASKDLALIQFPKGERNITPMALESEGMTPGELVIAIGNPYGFQGAVTYGSIQGFTTLTVLNQAAIEHTAVLARGSSGGALVNQEGKLIGINTWGMDNRFYAIPLSEIILFLTQNNNQ